MKETRVAGFTDQQQAIQDQVAGLQTPGQFGTFSSRFTTRYKFRLGAAQTGITSALELYSWFSC